MHYDRSCFLSRCVTSIQKIVSHNRAAIRGALVQIARCVYVTRNEDDTYHVILSQMPFWNANNHSTQYLIIRFLLADYRRIKLLVPTYVCDKLDHQQYWCYADRK